MPANPEHLQVAADMDAAASVMERRIDRAVACAAPGAPLDWSAFYPDGAADFTNVWIDTILQMQLAEINDSAPVPARPCPAPAEFFGLLPPGAAADWIRGAAAHTRHLADGIRSGRPDLLLAIDASA